MLTTIRDTQSWLEYIHIRNYTIHPDSMVVDVRGDVNLRKKELNFIPVSFGVVTGDFNCEFNSLKSLKGCPTHIHGQFFCNNNQLSTLEHSPVIVGKSYRCNNNNLTTLLGATTHIGEHFTCNYNQLTTLEHAPLNVGASLLAKYNPFWHFENHIELIGGSIYLPTIDKYPEMNKQFLNFDKQSIVLTLKELNTFLLYKNLNENLDYKTKKTIINKI